MAFGKKVDLQGLSDEEVDALAFDKIMYSVSAAEQSTAKMCKKLEGAGFPAPSIARSLDKACRLGAIDDRRYSECLIRSTVACGKGLELIKREIDQLGIDIETLDAYAEYVDEGVEGQLENAIDYIMRHPPHSKNPYASCYRKLMSRGFGHDVAQAASKAFVQSL